MYALIKNKLTLYKRLERTRRYSVIDCYMIIDVYIAVPGIFMLLILYISIYIYNCLCGSGAKASDTQAVGHWFDPRPDH